DIIAMKQFSWTRFLTRVERTLPPEVRVTSVAVSRPDIRSVAMAQAPIDVYAVTFNLYSRDPEGLPKLVRAFYASPWFDEPKPSNEEGPEKGKTANWRIGLAVKYLDAGKK